MAGRPAKQHGEPPAAYFTRNAKKVKKREQKNRAN
jgi:hypothetical protein